MTEPVPADGVSAFFDEELSPSELKEIAHHLSRSPAAQSELSDIRRLSEELRNLPQESAPRSLLSGVMRDVHGKAIPASSGWDEAQPRLRAMGIVITAALVLVVCIAVLPSLWKEPEPAKTDATIAAMDSGETIQDPTGHMAMESALPAEPKAAKPMVRHLGSEGEMLVEGNRARILANSEGLPRAGSGGGNTGLNGIPPAALPMPLGIAETTSPKPSADGDKLKFADPEMKPLLASAAQSKDRVVVVEVKVEDTASTLKRLQNLLAQNSVAPANFALEEAEAEVKKQLSEADSEVALFVQSTPEQLAGALQSLQEQQADSRLNALSNLALGDILLRDVQDNELAGKDKTANEASRSLAQIVSLYESRQGGQAFGGKVAPGAVMRSNTKPDGDDRAARAAKTVAGLENAPSVASADFGVLKVQEKSQEKQSGQTAWNSFQFVLKAPKDAWRRETLDKTEQGKEPAVALQTRRANVLADQVGEPAQGVVANSPADQVKKEPAPRPIRTLFLFRSNSQAK